ncbi:MAG TPA: hypothetical protein PKD09_16900 [Aggregatilinea sp.]|jgi:hypothetical protein|uniref:hypothetical protein n=1 Tax=Aggregatilinea sp. TaxID=2806333 RepID=UPI002CBB66B6|nr:hypothetical protein [Aggregatilinea sp.]HML23336.1 hypothetical protein [Aggregatilinea sp.]
MSSVTTETKRTTLVGDALDRRIAELVELIRAGQQQMATLDGRIALAKDELRDLLSERGSNWSDDSGYAQLTSEGVRRSYDTRALDELIITDPLRYGWLKDYRRESRVNSGVRVK